MPARRISDIDAAVQEAALESIFKITGEINSILGAEFLPSIKTIQTVDWEFQMSVARLTLRGHNFTNHIQQWFAGYRSQPKVIEFFGTPDERPGAAGRWDSQDQFWAKAVVEHQLDTALMLLGLGRVRRSMNERDFHAGIAEAKVEIRKHARNEGIGRSEESVALACFRSLCARLEDAMRSLGIFGDPWWWVIYRASFSEARFLEFRLEGLKQKGCGDMERLLWLKSVVEDRWIVRIILAVILQ